MAKENKDKAQAAAPKLARPPKNLARVGSVANAPWFNLAEGNVLHGVLENVYERPDERSRSGKSKFFQILLTEPAEVRSGRGNDAELVMAEVGTVVNLNYGPKTKELEKFIPDILRGAKFEVWCHVDGPKFDIGKRQSMWPIDVRAGMIREASAMEDEPDFEDAPSAADASSGSEAAF